MQLIVDFAGHLHITKTQVVEDAVVMAATTYNLATESLSLALGELAQRYGDDAPLTIRVVPGDDDQGEVVALIDSLPPDDVITALSIDEQAGVAHVFVDVDGWYPTRLGTTQLGGEVLLTRPLRSITSLPWPANPTLGLIGRLGELAEQPKAGRLIAFDAVAT